MSFLYILLMDIKDKDKKRYPQNCYPMKPLNLSNSIKYLIISK